MKRITVLLCAALVCIWLLSACGIQNQTQQNNPAPPPVNEQTPSTDIKEEVADTGSEKEAPISIDHLAVELVAEWEQGDRFLSELKNLSQLLKDSLLARGYQVDEITITISTAGGFTADALNNGGVDLAFLPAVDFITCSEEVLAVLTTDEEICSLVTAVNRQKDGLDDAFCAALAQALLETESGTAFLNTYQPDINFVPATETAIQAVRDWVAEQEKEH